MIDDFLSHRHRKSQALDIPLAAWGVAAGVAVVGLVLLFMARPPSLKARFEALQTQAAAIKASGQKRGDLSAFPVGTVCASVIDDTMRNQLTNALMNSGLKIETLDITDTGQAGDRYPLRSYSLSLKGSGSYDDAMRTLQALNRYRPRLFLDTLSLRNQTSSVDLDVEGRLFCRWKS